MAGVLLLVAGEARAFALLRSLAVGHLRDATRSTLDAVLELLGLLQPILEVADPELAGALASHGLPPFFALSWFITWFAHDMPDLGGAARLFDLFLASHPLMPLYVGAAAMRSQRATLLACEEMPELHSALMKLNITRAATIDELAQQVGERCVCVCGGGVVWQGLHLPGAAVHVGAVCCCSWQMPMYELINTPYSFRPPCSPHRCRRWPCTHSCRPVPS